jgi:crotonobetainyl-CoA:carnitine CoA-transferase CaiB-like acyl-CoA transferase
MSASSGEYRRAPPLLGEHTDEVLRELAGLDAAAIARLRAQRVL